MHLIPIARYVFSSVGEIQCVFPSHKKVLDLLCEDQKNDVQN